MARDKLKLAFFGAGERARPYLDALARRPEVALTAVCDPERRAAEQTAAGWGARVFQGYEAMLEEARPDALWICVPPHLQGQVVQRAVEGRIPFFIEPPGAADYEQARLYGRLVGEAGMVAAVGFPTRHTDVVREAREYLGANPVPLALGWWLRPLEETTEPSSGLGLLWNDACRLVDALRYFCGEVTRVHARSPGNAPGGLVVQLEFAGGSAGVLTCAAFPRPEPRVRLELLGDGWSLEFGGGPVDPAQPLVPLSLVERDRTTILRCLNAPAADGAEAFLEAVAAGNPAAVVASYAEALRTLTVCHAAAVSVREGQPADIIEGMRDEG
jgi:predicted dehydrogenase